jgi:hypothetical protein
MTPSVSIVSPAGGATFTAPASITAIATPATATPIRRWFTPGRRSARLDRPLQRRVDDVPAGSYALTAVATDNRGATSSVPARSRWIPPRADQQHLQPQRSTASSPTADPPPHANNGTGRPQSAHGYLTDGRRTPRRTVETRSGEGHHEAASSPQDSPAGRADATTRSCGGCAPSRCALERRVCNRSGRDGTNNNPGLAPLRGCNGTTTDSHLLTRLLNKQPRRRSRSSGRAAGPADMLTPRPDTPSQPMAASAMEDSRASAAPNGRRSRALATMPLPPGHRPCSNTRRFQLGIFSIVGRNAPM